MNVINLGAGVQSSTMALMAAHGEIEPMPDVAIFADTMAEPLAVYTWLKWLVSQLPFPVHIVAKDEGLRASVMDAVLNKTFNKVPFFTESESGGGLLRRQCTQEFKITPIRQHIRGLLGLGKGQRAPREILATSWIGISTDEASRMKPSRDHYIAHRWPLIEAGMSRFQCLEWMAKKGYPTPPKSACTFCPYHSDAMWRDMKMNDEKSWDDAVIIDKRIRNGVRGTTQKLYLHRSLKPLDEIDFRNAEDFGQQSMFDDECEGMCGV